MFKKTRLVSIVMLVLLVLALFAGTVFARATWRLVDTMNIPPETGYLHVNVKNAYTDGDMQYVFCYVAEGYQGGKWQMLELDGMPGYVICLGPNASANWISSSSRTWTKARVKVWLDENQFCALTNYMVNVGDSGPYYGRVNVETCY